VPLARFGAQGKLCRSGATDVPGRTAGLTAAPLPALLFAASGVRLPKDWGAGIG